MARQPALWGLLLAFGSVGPRVVVAQGFSVSLPVEPARIAGMGGVGAAVRVAEAWGVNPAAISSEPDLTVRVSLAQRKVAEVSEYAAAAIAPSDRIGVFALEIRQRRVHSPVEDPALAGDPELQVGDWAATFGWGNRFLHDRLAVGIAVEYAGVRVFGTTGSAFRGRVGSVVTLREGTHIGVALAGLGSEMAWRTAEGERFYSQISPLLRAGVWQGWQSRRVALELSADGAFDWTPSTLRALRAGGELAIGSVFAVRAGITNDRSGSTAITSPSMGLGLAIRRVRIALAQEGIGDSVAERFSVDVSLRR